MSASTPALSVQETGRGPPAVMVHGLAGSWRYFARGFSALAAHRRLIVPDLLGFGRSPWPNLTYSVDVHLAALSDAIDAHDGDTVDLVGHSFGALLAVEWAARNPTRLRSLTLLSMPYFKSSDEAFAAARGAFWGRAILDAPRAARVACATICARRRFWTPLLSRMLQGTFPPEVVEDGMRHSYQSVTSTLKDAILPHRLDAALRAVAGLSIPVRVVHGALDDQAPLHGAKEVARLLPRATLTVHPTDCHNFPLPRLEAHPTVPTADPFALFRASGPQRRGQSALHHPLVPCASTLSSDALES